MRLHLYGGFGEKGRTCLGVEVDGYRLLLDAGVKTSARGADYYPASSARPTPSSSPTPTRTMSRHWAGA
jgi:predicted metal-dependent RNase